jgi:2'-5' RNA ligase
MDETTIRCFLAIDPPEEILREIGRIQERLQRMIRGEVRWVRPEAIHLTLKFFGDIPESAIADIAEIVGEAAAGAAPFSLAISGAGVFPDQRRPRILWLGMEGDVPRLLSFQQELEGKLGIVGFSPEERPFRPHLTLARIKSPQGLTGLEQVLENGEGYAAGRFLPAGLSLFRSELTPRGAVYTKLKWFPFA